MDSPILVTGGTGRLGRHVVSRLRNAGRDVRVLSRHNHRSGDGIEYVTGDLATGEGLEAAVEGTEIIVHCAGSRKGDEDKARHLVPAASRATLRHLVYISVVGADRIPVASSIDRVMFGYFASKLAAERVVADSGLPWTTLRATQFHDGFLATFRGMAKVPVIPVPSGFRFQPIDEREVATRLVELALGAPAGLVSEIGGPRAYTMADLFRGYLRASGRHRLIVPAWVPGKAAAAIRAGAILAPDRAVGQRTWEEFLAERVGSPGERRIRPDTAAEEAVGGGAPGGTRTHGL
ncbi:MAG: SDR family oxidoreductase [Candidatus Limnocylindrales bacterium]